MNFEKEDTMSEELLKTEKKEPRDLASLERENKDIKKKLADKTRETQFLQKYLVFITLVFVALIVFVAR